MCIFKTNIEGFKIYQHILLQISVFFGLLIEIKPFIIYAIL